MSNLLASFLIIRWFLHVVCTSIIDFNRLVLLMNCRRFWFCYFFFFLTVCISKRIFQYFYFTSLLYKGISWTKVLQIAFFTNIQTNLVTEKPNWLGSHFIFSSILPFKPTSWLRKNWNWLPSEVNTLRRKRMFWGKRYSERKRVRRWVFLSREFSLFLHEHKFVLFCNRTRNFYT